MVAIGGRVRVGGPQGERVVAGGRFYHNDGINYLTKQPDEISPPVRLAPGRRLGRGLSQAAAARLVRLSGAGRGGVG